ncbi:MAG: protein-tyrosine-phosphatase [Bacteroidetes bacterium]|nr:protein-tyrosine-phosphatase [Bacteroidota bacterium]
MKDLNRDLQVYCSERINEFELISDVRKKLLKEIAQYISYCIQNSVDLNLCFICTHNSRRSLFGQLWSQVAAKWIQLDDFRAYSGGTEATAANERAIASLRRSGFIINNQSTVNKLNPRYVVKLADHADEMIVFSKVYTHPDNPEDDFAAIMVCSDAEQSCPFIPGAEKRFYLPYDDPKEFDGTAFEIEKYDERSKQIAREMLYLFMNVNMSL